MNRLAIVLLLASCSQFTSITHERAALWHCVRTIDVHGPDAHIYRDFLKMYKHELTSQARDAQCAVPSSLHVTLSYRTAASLMSRENTEVAHKLVLSVDYSLVTGSNVQKRSFSVETNTDESLSAMESFHVADASKRALLNDAARRTVFQ